MSDTSLKIALVTPWFGRELTGGAERTAWQLAQGLCGRGHDVTVFTTCARAFASDWSVEAYRPGAASENGVNVRRFRVDRRDPNAFDRANDVLLGQSPSFYARNAFTIGQEIADAFLRNSINASDLIEHLRRSAEQYTAIIIIPYLYGLCIEAVRVAASRAMLVPCLHDEPYAYLPIVEDTFRAARVLAFNTEGESRLAARIFGPAVMQKAMTVGQWIEPSHVSQQSVKRVRGFDPLARRYLLYLGRRDGTKNVDLLVESFTTFRRRERMSGLELVLIGPGQRSYHDASHGIIDLGEVSDAQKAALLTSAWGIVQPSINESFSRAVMEAWSVGAPVAVNARCEATSSPVLESGGGWTATTKAQWSRLFDRFDRLSRQERDRVGKLGHAYAEGHTVRDEVLSRIEAAIRSIEGPSPNKIFDVRPDRVAQRHLADGRKTILFAGRLTEGSGIDRLLTAFAFLLSFGIDAKLVIFGTFEPSEALETRFFNLVASAALSDRVIVLESEDPTLAAACYRNADLFWSMSEDGPMTELIDAIGYGVPIFAFSNEHSREAMGASGLLFRDQNDAPKLAGVAALLLTDRSLTTLILESQRRRYQALHSQDQHSLVG